jgi:hypothetical protein
VVEWLRQAIKFFGGIAEVSAEIAALLEVTLNLLGGRGFGFAS